MPDYVISEPMYVQLMDYLGFNAPWIASDLEKQAKQQPSLEEIRHLLLLPVGYRESLTAETHHASVTLDPRD